MSPMSEKTEPIGICDLCTGEIPPERWYTRRGPRRYCSRECRNTGNSRAGNPARIRKAKQRVADGTWFNPTQPATPEEQGRRARLGRLREVAEGRWRNPALTEEAREKLSRPRVHSGALHRAMEKLEAGKGGMATLRPGERAAYLAYRQDMRERKKRTMSITTIRPLTNEDVKRLAETSQRFVVRHNLAQVDDPSNWADVRDWANFANDNGAPGTSRLWLRAFRRALHEPEADTIDNGYIGRYSK